MKMESKHILMGIAALIVIALFAASATSVFESKPANNSAQQATNTETSIASVGSDGFQTINMRVEGGQYVFEPKAVVKGKHVRIIADVSRIPGCSKSFTIPEYGIRKYLTAADNIIEFTPQKAGQLYVACSMNMYRGILVVAETPETASAAVAAATSSQAASTQTRPTGSCGCGGGGCGG